MLWQSLIHLLREQWEVLGVFKKNITPCLMIEKSIESCKLSGVINLHKFKAVKLTKRPICENLHVANISQLTVQTACTSCTENFMVSEFVDIHDGSGKILRASVLLSSTSTWKIELMQAQYIQDYFRSRITLCQNVTNVLMPAFHTWSKGW